MDQNVKGGVMSKKKYSAMIEIVQTESKLAFALHILKMNSTPPNVY